MFYFLNFTKTKHKPRKLYLRSRERILTVNAANVEENRAGNGHPESLFHSEQSLCNLYKSYSWFILYIIHNFNVCRLHIISIRTDPSISNVGHMRAKTVLYVPSFLILCSFQSHVLWMGVENTHLLARGLFCCLWFCTTNWVYLH